MATAVQPGTAAPTPDPKVRLAIASATGTACVLAALAAIAIYLPQFLPFQSAVARLLVQLVALAALFGAANFMAGSNPIRGLRGGIFLGVSFVIATFFVVRAVGLNLEETSIGAPITLAVLGGCLFGGFRLLTSRTGQDAMEAIEEQGLLHTFGYKKSQGQRVRRWTMVGILLLGGTGVWVLWRSEMLSGDWVLRLPFLDKSITILNDIALTVPLLLAFATFWFAWRAVNMPAFADFLIATEAEMNKVSWSTKKKLVQDTIVVLVTTVLLTLFLLFVDLFWGWLLSTNLIHVLPNKDDRLKKDEAGNVIVPSEDGTKKVDW